jgi:glucose-1-phosphate thymidylyltransferase
VLANKSAEFAGVSARFDESVTIIEPCFIGDGVSLKNCQIGPFVSIGNKTELENCNISNSIIQEKCSIRDFNCHDTMIGNSVVINGAQTASQVYSLGDFSSIG